jgi:XTP/dITP diphosphohydrolase
MPVRPVLLAPGPGTSRGHLPWQAWRTVRAARVLGRAGGGWSTALEAAGVPVEPLDESDPEGVVVAVAHACSTSSAVVWVVEPDAGGRATAERLAHDVHGGVDLLPVDPEGAGTAVLALAAVMDRLRSPGGCPWDAEQTHTSLLPYLIEEAYEVVDAVRSGSLEDLREELGDLLLQVVFHARIAEEGEDGFALDDVARGIVDKLVRRHPHVFADADAPTAADVETRWAELKRQEKGRTSVLDGVPRSQPALLLAQTYLRKAAVLPSAPSAPEGAGLLPADEAGLGRLLLAVCAAASDRGWDAEAALRAAADEFAAAVRAAEGDDPT